MREGDWGQLGRYLAGECSPSERAQIERLLATNPDAAQAARDAALLWQRSAAADDELVAQWDVDAMSRRLASRLRDGGRADRFDETSSNAASRSAPDATAEAISSDEPIRTIRMRRSSRGGSRPTSWTERFAPLVRVAALLVVGVGLGLLYRRVREEAPAGDIAMVARVLQTGKAQRATYRLADGSTVTLAPESELRIAPDFHRETREVTLVGAAVFEVEPDRSRPFVVHTNRAVTRVLGTQFGVRAYPDEADVEVVVARGQVALRESADSAAAGVTLGPGQLGRFAANGHLELVNGVDANRLMQWTSGELYFDGTPLKAIARELEHWYALKVLVPDTALAKRRVRANLRLEPAVGPFLDALAISLDVRVERHGDSVTFRPRTR